MTTTSKRTKHTELSTDEDDFPEDAIWLFPFDDYEEMKKPTKAGAAPFSPPAMVTKALPLPKPSPPITSEERLASERTTALLFAQMIETHPMREKLHLTDKGVHLRTENPYSNQIETVFLNGITAQLAQTICPHKHYKPTVANGGATAWETKESADDGKSKPRLSRTTIEQDSLERGKQAHRQMDMYSKLYVDEMAKGGLDRDKSFEDFNEKFNERILALRMGYISPVVKAIAQIYNMEQYQFIPVASELPVCDGRALDSYFTPPPPPLPNDNDRINEADAWFIHGKLPNPSPPQRKVLYGSVVDAIVYSPRQRCLCFMEFTTTTGDFFHSKDTMLPPLEILENNVQNRKAIQLTLSIEYFKRTYGSIFADNKISEKVYGFVVCVSPDGSRSNLHAVSPEVQESYLKLLKKTNFLV